MLGEGGSCAVAATAWPERASQVRQHNTQTGKQLLGRKKTVSKGGLGAN